MVNIKSTGFPPDFATTNFIRSSNSTAGSILEKECREEWPLSVCMFANVAGLCSTAVWFIVLFPQVIQNFIRKSVKGLSVIWATANFTASLVNLFFVYKLGNLPLYSRISAIYMPCLEVVMMYQFLLYGKYAIRSKIVYTAWCCFMWISIVTSQLVYDIYEEMEWIAITLWATETIPQILLNLWRRNTDGISRIMVCFAMMGKTTDFIANNVLKMPLQIVVMIYFSSSTAYINGILVAYYGVGKLTLAQFWRLKLGKMSPISAVDADVTSATAAPTLTGGAENMDRVSDDNTRYVDNVRIEVSQLPHTKWLVVRTLAAVIPSVLLLVYAICFILNTGTLVALLAPTGILAVIIAAYILVHYYPQYARWMGKL